MCSDETKADKTFTKTKKAGAENVKIQQLFKLMVESGGSDLHLTVGTPPGLRVNGEIVRVKIPALTAVDTKRLIYQILTEEQKNELEKNLELDFSFGIKGLARFRSNVFYSKGGVAAVFRQIPSIIPDFKALRLPNVLLEMTDVSNGLILVTGPTGSGKSTTLAALIDRLNENESGHIITLEDPVEFVHPHKSCIVNQREIGTDSLNFKSAMKSLLRQDPDIVLVGEMRDVETIEAALTIAETGHLVFGTLHTNSCVQTINRIINVFPADHQDQVRTLLSFVLQGVISQQLLPKSFEPGRCLGMEVLVPTPAIRNLIREDKIHQVYSQMQIGQDKTGMMTMNQTIKKHVDAGLIDTDTAMSYSTNPEELAKQLGVKGR
ncbi:type IV pili twitching motility protein PilT [Halobacteriovorax marinus]|uniref:Twitching mobility protein n=1 Tax=Halobacteriovorax marinus (strain ATCC BAA-682 / DSM 15412 / SJ) TaxID=862908 RepID=E1X2A2_HALMS|nr:type IV pilus twitching motility protein PilT [Halobacteriovorax marinus]ATH06492.1 type IV pili twitching motility protein PilT [Halobacteriovorax marinus]CBW25058.1 putative twitching mobility protein [Halobacteriovorax marinus SJ]